MEKEIKIKKNNNETFDVEVITNNTGSLHQEISEKAMQELLNIYKDQGYKVTEQENQTFKNNDIPLDFQDFPSMAQIIISLPSQIKEKELRLIGLENRENANVKKRDSIKNRIFAEVTNEKTDEEKPKSKYSNEKLREAETISRCVKNEEYQKTTEEFEKITQEKKETQAEINYLRRMMRGIDIVVSINKLMYRVE